MTSALPKPTTLRVRLSSTAETIVRQGHPWVFADSIRSQTREGTAGELAVVFDRHDRFLAVGLYDPDSPLRIRVLHTGKPLKLDTAWWRTLFEKSLDRRAGHFNAKTNGLRWINGESDGWPGLVCDQYGEVLVLKIYSQAWFPHLEKILPLLLEKLKPQSIVLRLSRNIQDAVRKTYKLRDGDLLYGELNNEAVPFLESGLNFYADVIRGQKTGFFLDQRENRRKVEALSRGKHVLNLFSFSGGFSLYAARGGATHVTSVDITEHALKELQKNWEANPVLASVPHDEIQADVFEWLEEAEGSYDLIIMDPPSLAKREIERGVASRAYEKLAFQGIKLLRKGGIMVCCSCSAHVSVEEFTESVRHAMRKSGRKFQELEITGHAPDHPCTVIEMNYLKAIYLKEIA